MDKPTIAKLTVFCDGGARGNPGPAGIGFLMTDEKGKELVRHGEAIGKATNNVAEYTAVRLALSWLVNSLKGRDQRAIFYLDSQLVVNQLNGNYKIKNAKLRELVIEVRSLEQELRKQKGIEIEYNFIPRDKNEQADALVNQALDGQA